MSRSREDECREIAERLQLELPDFERRSAEASAAIRSVLEDAGAEPGDLPCDETGLARVESFLFEVAHGRVDVDRVVFERLVGWFLAQCLIENAGARWAVHDVCTEKWRPYIVLFLGDRKLAPFPFATAVYSKGVGKRPRRPLSRLFRDSL